MYGELSETGALFRYPKQERPPYSKELKRDHTLEKSPCVYVYVKCIACVYSRVVPSEAEPNISDALHTRPRSNLEERKGTLFGFKGILRVYPKP